MVEAEARVRFFGMEDDLGGGASIAAISSRGAGMTSEGEISSDGDLGWKGPILVISSSASDPSITPAPLGATIVR